jgi:glycosyltransferase involved in cell wall biosynthesis
MELTGGMSERSAEGAACGSGTTARLAVLIPAYRDQAGLERSLASLAQDGADFDGVVVDDGSEPPIRVPDGLPFRLTLLRLDANRGITGALNAGLKHIKQAGYAYVARLDCGDISLPGRMAAQVAFLDEQPEHAVIGCWAEWVDLKGQPVFVFRPPADDGDLRRFQRYRVGLVHPAVTMRMTALNEMGFYEERFGGAEEYELFLRLARRHKLANLPVVYLKVELNPHSLSARRFRHGVVRLRVQARHFEARSAHAWLGFGRNLLLLFVPRGLMVGAKRWLAHVRGNA